MSLHALAIIIPAYKGEYFAAALASIRAQTDQRFHLYVGDDASPAPLHSLYRGVYAADENTSYVRFEQNLGGASLVAQWNRCVNLTSEPWVWLFSDDDLADPTCVAKFYAALDAGTLACNVCRFNTATIDKNGTLLLLHAPHPASEEIASFAYHRLTFQRRSFAPDYIFRRSSYQANGGFVDFPFALGSDDASWITFALDLPIVTLPDALVYWRLSGANTSVLDPATGGKKIVAMALFSRWMEARFRNVSPPSGALTMPTQIDMALLARHWLAQSVRAISPDFGWRRSLALAGEMQQRGFGGRTAWTLRFWRAIFLAKIAAYTAFFRGVLRWK